MIICIINETARNSCFFSRRLDDVWSKVQHEMFQLPVKLGTDNTNYSQDDIDWDYMESYIRIMEKRVIADVVDYKNEVIALTKNCVTEN